LTEQFKKRQKRKFLASIFRNIVLTRHYGDTRNYRRISDGKFDAAVFRPTAATWFLNQSTAGTGIIGFGASTDTPVANAFIP
jgi:hypothetical protein